ncbi:SusD/RagB family nutrient-binding outer membrane lipoprotein [Myroides odoratimimus]|uniref:SusD/RagB family nutrient-binding outer membrane lipoprotein n=1 Tax=Myroides TaxID=76831 RepID=UPI00057F656B|nr:MULTISPECIES: SusD/RagB family nutrient-binding outer membrane lipoprotein [Myroides]AJA67905.1 Starch-binding associating with outer membrane/Susd and RagB outer membrane lipoprotein [Myroides sp. A21]MDM1327975.1 SusD/RagB family nutrient-binding outer membrane lipoprotein [Myroides odoratimimus]MDM1493978.1 SusD/RagB family nutrient-binding outer membrane lipoprotein [Myroides odoratimimus]MDM1498418.1 SusD/RagB family nutrient-binding outer membrane lipoprotein [Myroides odoratimimus]MD
MKKYIYKMSLLACFMAFVSCDKDLETINENPNLPKEVRTNGLFNGANKDLMTKTRGGFPSGRMALPWVQYSAQRNYTAEDRHQFRVGVNNSLYRDIYLAVKNYKEIIDIVDDPKNAARVATYGDPANQKAAARIMIAYAQLQAVDMYGDVPYYSYSTEDDDFQGMTLTQEGEIATPKFAPQEKIYKDLMKQLKEAADEINMNASNVFNSGDFLFGSPLKLKKFANSLRLKIANRVKGVIPEANAHLDELKANLDFLMQSNNDNVAQKFQNDKVNPAPFYRAGFIDKRNDFSPTNIFVEMLKGESKVAHKNPFDGIVDPRLYRMVAPTTQLLDVKKEDGTIVKEEVAVDFLNNSVSVPSIELGNYIDRDGENGLKFYQGMPIGIQDELAGGQADYASQFSAEVYKADYEEVLMEYAEVAFILAELGIDTENNYKNGIKASMERWKVNASAINDYLSKVGSSSLEKIMTQKYIALYMQPYEAWAEYRRTKFPKNLLLPGQSHDLIVPEKEVTSYVFESLKGLNDLPERLEYPTDMNLVNKNNKDAAAARMGGDKMDTKLIWAKK